MTTKKVSNEKNMNEKNFHSIQLKKEEKKTKKINLPFQFGEMFVNCVALKNWFELSGEHSKII